MDGMHLASTGLAVGTLVVAATGGDRIVRVLGGRQARDLTIVGAGALAVGNAVSLLPDAPRWYSLTLLSLTMIAVLWLGLRLGDAPAPARPVLVTNATRQPARARRGAPTVPLYSVAHVGVVDAEVVADTAPAPVSSIHRNRVREVATFDDLLDRAPAGSRATVGTGRYVAANITELAGRRTARAEFGPRRHGVPATSNDTARRIRVLRAYGASAPLRGRLRDERA